MTGSHHAHITLCVCVCVCSCVLSHFDVCLLQDSSQIGLLKELLDLQKDMVVMLLSLLEGTVIVLFYFDVHT